MPVYETSQIKVIYRTH